MLPPQRLRSTLGRESLALESGVAVAEPIRSWRFSRMQAAFNGDLARARKPRTCRRFHGCADPLGVLVQRRGDSLPDVMSASHRPEHRTGALLPLGMRDVHCSPIFIIYNESYSHPAGFPPLLTPRRIIAIDPFAKRPLGRRELGRKMLWDRTPFRALFCSSRLGVVVIALPFRCAVVLALGDLWRYIAVLVGYWGSVSCSNYHLLFEGPLD
jgi:hypothetical protein